MKSAGWRSGLGSPWGEIAWQPRQLPTVRWVCLANTVMAHFSAYWCCCGWPALKERRKMSLVEWVVGRPRGVRLPHR